MMFSVIIPAYNAGKFIQNSIRSVLNQSYQNFEILIIDDGSSDDTFIKASMIQDVRIKIIQQKNSGVSIARNTGIKKSIGQFICFLDSDDEFLHDHLLTIKNMIDKHPDQKFFVTKFQNKLLDGSIVKTKTSGSIKYYSNAVDLFIKNAEIVWTGCVCISRGCFENYGMFEPNVSMGEDRDMWMRIFTYTGIVLSDNITVQRNRDGSEATKEYQRRFKVDEMNRLQTFLNDPSVTDEVKHSLRVYHEYEKLAVIRSYIYINDKKIAKIKMREIDRKLIPSKRLYSTKMAILMPNWIIKFIIKLKNKNMYRGIKK